MDSPMLKMLKSQNPGKEYPSNVGLKWFDDEETLLLEELNKNIDIATIAQNHNRTIGGINSRLKEIAYRMFLKNISIEEIIEKTKLDEECIQQTIDKRKNSNSKKIIETKKPFSVENEIAEMKNEIKELKNIIKEFVEIVKSLYEFEDA